MLATPWRKAAWRFGPPLLWTLVITGFSTDRFSSAQTSHVLMPVLHWLFPQADPGTVALMHAALRKAMHVLVFAVLVLLLTRALRAQFPRARLSPVALALIVALSVAGLDEVHQSFNPERTGKALDVGWDGLGATLALVVRRLIWRA
jgi:VanZ family protein